VAVAAVCAVGAVVAGHSAGAGRAAAPFAGSTTATPRTGAGVAPADIGRDPGSLTGWKEVIADLYRRRAAVFAAPAADGGEHALAGVYAPGSPQLDVDRTQVRALAQAREMLRGFAPTVVEVNRASTGGDRVELRLVDRWARYDVVPVGRGSAMPLRTGPARPPADVRMVLLHTAAGWRIAEVGRLT
jgi:hypothetical protein